MDDIDVINSVRESAVMPAQRCWKTLRLVGVPSKISKRRDLAALSGSTCGCGSSKSREACWIAALMAALSTACTRSNFRCPMLLNLGINLKHGGDGRARSGGNVGQVTDLYSIYSLETPCVSGPGAGGNPVDRIPSAQSAEFYPQIAQCLGVSNTGALWTAVDGPRRFFEICETGSSYVGCFSRN